MDVQIKQMGEKQLATVRHMGPYNRISEAFERLHETAGAAGLLAGPHEVLGIYWDDPTETPEEELRSDAAVVVPEGTELPEGLAPMTIPAGRFASCLHVGPYELLAKTWGDFYGGWFPGSGEEISGEHFMEMYHNAMDAAPEDLKTELLIPLKG